jgi:hypothetical protein
MNILRQCYLGLCQPRNKQFCSGLDNVAAPGGVERGAA